MGEDGSGSAARNEDEPAMGVTGIDDAIGDGFCVGDMRGSADGVWIGSDEAVGAMEVDGSDGRSPSVCAEVDTGVECGWAEETVVDVCGEGRR